MAKSLNVKLVSQAEIVPEGTELPTKVTRAKKPQPKIAVGKRPVQFLIPDHPEELSSQVTGHSPEIQDIVDRINQHVENIADDYFLLGLQLIALHRLLRQAQLTNAQVRSWYAEHVNMPYSSAMQCKKVAEVYEENPELISRYTASGAYLLSSCQTQEEREEIWDEARGKKKSPTIRELRAVLKERQERQQMITEEQAIALDLPRYKMSERRIHDGLNTLVKHSKHLISCYDPEKRVKLRKKLAAEARSFIRKMEEEV